MILLSFSSIVLLIHLLLIRLFNNCFCQTASLWDEWTWGGSNTDFLLAALGFHQCHCLVECWQCKMHQVLALLRCCSRKEWSSRCRQLTNSERCSRRQGRLTKKESRLNLQEGMSWPSNKKRACTVPSSSSLMMPFLILINTSRSSSVMLFAYTQFAVKVFELCSVFHSSFLHSTPSMVDSVHSVSKLTGILFASPTCSNSLRHKSLLDEWLSATLLGFAAKCLIHLVIICFLCTRSTNSTIQLPSQPYPSPSSIVPLLWMSCVLTKNHNILLYKLGRWSDQLFWQSSTIFFLHTLADVLYYHNFVFLLMPILMLLYTTFFVRYNTFCGEICLSYKSSAQLSLG